MGLGTRLLKATEELGKGAAVQKCRLTVFKVGGSSRLMTVAQSQSLFAVCGSHGLRNRSHLSIKVWNRCEYLFGELGIGVL